MQVDLLPSVSSFVMLLWQMWQSDNNNSFPTMNLQTAVIDSGLQTAAYNFSVGSGWYHVFMEYSNASVD